VPGDGPVAPLSIARYPYDLLICGSVCGSQRQPRVPLIMRNHVLDAWICGALDSHTCWQNLAATFTSYSVALVSTSIFTHDRYLVGGLRTRFVSHFISIVVSSLPQSTVSSMAAHRILPSVTSQCVSVVFLVSRSDGDSRFHGEDVIQNRYHSYIPCMY
jgi:hypothetical protein